MTTKDVHRLQRPYWDADIYVYRVTSPKAYRYSPVLVNGPLDSMVTVKDFEAVQVQRFERVSGRLLYVSHPNKYSSVPYVSDGDLRAIIVRGAIVEWQEKTGRLEDARAFTVELIDDREAPWKPAYPSKSA